MTNAHLPFGIDVSYWQGHINWDVVAANQPKVEFVGIRAANSWGYQDPRFVDNWLGAKRVGIARTAYHVFFPGEDPIRQMNHFLAVVGSDPGELPLTIDIELHHNVHPDRFRARLHQALDYLKQRTHRTPIIYSRASFFDTYVTGMSVAPTWYSQYDWWLAHYLLSGEEHKGPPPLPKGVPRSRVIIHQTSDRGKPFGVESKALDYNRWQFPIGHFRSYIVTSEQPAPVDSEGRLRRLEFSIRDFFAQLKK